MKRARYTAVQLPQLFFLQAETLTMNGVQQYLSIPSTADTIQMEVETAAVYYHINGSAHDATAPGYIAADGVRVLSRQSLLNSVGVWGTVGGGAVLHVNYFVEK